MPEVGDIWFVDFGPSRPREPAYSRPAVVLAPMDRTDWGTTQVLAVPLTTTVREYEASVRIERSDANGLASLSYAQVDMMRCLPISACARRVGRLDPEAWVAIRYLAAQFMGFQSTWLR